MIAQEMFHALRTKPSGRNKRMAIKTDMSKAYDIMELVVYWSYDAKYGFLQNMDHLDHEVHYVGKI